MKSLLCLLTLILIGCASSTYKVNQYQQNPKAKAGQFKGKRLFVAPLLLTGTSVSSTSPTVDSGKQALHIAKDSLAKVYGIGLNERFQKRFGNVTVVPQPDYARYNAVLTSDKLEETIHLYGKGKAEYYFKHPRKEVLDSLGIQADLIVYCTSVGVSIKDILTEGTGAMVAGGGGGTWSHGVSAGANGQVKPTTTYHPNGGSFSFGPNSTAKPKPLMQTFVKFIVWDYSTNTAVSYGQYQEDSGVNRDKIVRHWESLTATLTDRIVSNTAPLR